jgi:predicted transcriptional regulator
MAKRQYSDAEKAAALLALQANGGNITKTAREVGIPASTIKEWASGRVTAGVTDIRDEKKNVLADYLEDIAWKLAEAMPKKVRSAHLQQVATSMGITIDKMQLLRGKATAIVDDAVLTDEKRVERITQLLDAARARRDGQPAQSEPSGIPGVHPPG